MPLHRRPTGSGPPAWGHVTYTGAWLLSVVAAVLALFGAGGFEVAVLAIVPIVLLAPPALIGIRALLAGPAHDRHAAPAGAPSSGSPSSHRRDRIGG